MTKEIQVNIRLTREENSQLEKLALESVRSKSDMIRFLIRQEWLKQVGPFVSIEQETPAQVG
jgi:Ribbon-helix-helix protein, copG family